VTEIRAVFHGGPWDGRETWLPDPRSSFSFPLPGLNWSFDCEGSRLPVTLVDTYEAVLADDGHPSVDDAGRYRFNYRGRR
jgi:hypothetical protein